jgi:hypothetical protein
MATLASILQRQVSFDSGTKPKKTYTRNWAIKIDESRIPPPDSPAKASSEKENIRMIGDPEEKKNDLQNTLVQATQGNTAGSGGGYCVVM